MPLLDTLTAEKAASRKGPPCGMAVLLDRLDKDDRAALLQFLADRDGTTTAVIHRALATEGHRLGKNTIERHRRGDCACEQA